MAKQITDNEYQLQTDSKMKALSFLGGILVGGLTGAVTMLLLAPQSGKRTRVKIQQRSIELRDQTTDAIDDALAQTRHKAHQIRSGMYRQAGVIQQRGQDMLDVQKERISDLVEAGKSAVQGVLS